MKVTINPPTEFEHCFEVIALDCKIGTIITIENGSSNRIIARHDVRHPHEHFWLEGYGLRGNEPLVAKVEEGNYR